jgi:DNA mismatch endonuclease (patch repair protein)
MPITTKRERQKPPKPDELRSRIMRSNKSRGNVSTELTLVQLMRSRGIRGWRRGIAITGKPDFVFQRQRLAIFIDGCYWHGCKCRRLPKTNQSYWQQKFLANQERDRRVTTRLRKTGWSVMRFWEHQLKRSPKRVVNRIAAVLESLGQEER